MVLASDLKSRRGSPGEGPVLKRMLAHWRELSPDLRLIYWSTALAGLGHSAYDGLLAPFLREEGLAVEGVGLFYSAITAVGAAASLAGGILADRVGARPVIIAGRAFNLIGLALLLISRSPPFLALVALAWGLGLMTFPALSALVARQTTTANRATAFGLWETFGMAAGTVAPPGGGLLGDRFGPKAALLAGLPFAAASTLLAKNLRPDAASGPAPAGAEPRGGSGSLLAIYRGKTARVAAGASLLWFLCGVEMGLLRPVSSLLVVDNFGATWLSVGLVGTFSSIAAMAASLSGGILADRHGRLPITLASFLFGSVAFAALPWAPRLEVAYLGFFLLGLVITFNGPALSALTAEAVPAACRGRFLGLTSTLIMLGMMIGAAPAGVLYDLARWLPFAVAGILELTMAAIVWLVLRRAPVSD